MSLNTCIDFIQWQEYRNTTIIKVNLAKKIFANTYMLKKIKKCLYCGCEHEIKREKCPAFEKTCTNCLKKRTIFKQYANSKRKLLKELKKKKPICKSFQ